jgi:long-chain acyl-CoA synthetase
MQYGYWNEEKPAEPGFSKEFISSDFALIKDSTNTDALEIKGTSTVYAALEKLYKDPIKCNKPFLGTKVGAAYEWMTIKDTWDTAKNFAKGALSLNLVPEVGGEGKRWRFIGIQSKNRKEWNLIYCANMHMGATAVGLYDTLGEEASKYIINQTEMTTVACTSDIITKMIEWKKNDSDAQLATLKNIVSMDGKCSNDMLT